MSTARTLWAIRKDAPETDRRDPALALPLVRTGQPATRNGYVPADFKARTLDELREACGECGRDAVERAKWSAVSAWTMRAGILTKEGDAASTLSSEAWNRLTGKPEVLAGKCLTQRLRVTRLAVVGLLAWEAAGSPSLWQAIERTQRQVHVLRSDNHKSDLLAEVSE